MSANVTTATADQPKDRVFISPLAKRMAERAGVDVNLVPGTGPNGRIVLSDVEKFIAGMKAASSVTVSSNAAIFSTKAPVTSAPVIAKASNVATVEEPVKPVALAPALEVAPSPVVMSIPKVVAEISQTDLHSYLTVDCEVDEVLKLCDGMNEMRNAKVSLKDCAVRSLALALRQVMADHAKITTCNIGVAISTEKGTISPVIKQADSKTLIQIAADIEEMASKTVGGRLRSDEIEGAAMVIHASDKQGVNCCVVPVGAASLPLLSINAPARKVVVRENNPEVATVMTCSLSTNGAAINKDVGAEILLAFRKFMERPYMLIV